MKQQAAGQSWTSHGVGSERLRAVRQRLALEPIDPAILYWGTPVAILSTINTAGTPNLAPMSSVFWLGREAYLGLGRASHTLANLRRTGEVTICLPSAEQADIVNRLALTTGAPDVHPDKRARGYRYEPDKFGIAGVTPLTASTVAPPMVAELPVAMEAAVTGVRMGEHALVTADIRRVLIDPSIRAEGHEDRIDPLRWRPLIMSFQRLFGLGDEVRPSVLATVDEALYR